METVAFVEAYRPSALVAEPILCVEGSGTQRLGDSLGDLIKSSFPEIVASGPLDLATISAKAATWYWTQNNINAYADRGDFRGVCSLINRGEAVPTGPINGWDLRQHFHKRALEILPESTEPEEPVVPKEPSNCLEALEQCREIQEKIRVVSKRRRDNLIACRKERDDLKEELAECYAASNFKDERIEELERKLEEGEDMPDEPTTGPVEPGGPAPKPNVWEREPARIVALVAAIITAAGVFGLNLTQEQFDAILAVVESGLGLIIVLGSGEVIRSKVSPSE